jgi:hypothetical protein
VLEGRQGARSGGRRKHGFLERLRYFAGHDHYYNHLRADDGDANLDNDLHQFIVGTAGAPLRGEGDYGGNTGPWTPTKDIDDDGSDDPGAFERQYGYMVVEIDELDVTMTWWHRTGVGVYEATTEGLIYAVEPTLVPTLSPCSQLVLVAGLLVAGLSVGGWRATSSSPA